MSGRRTRREAMQYRPGCLSHVGVWRGQSWLLIDMTYRLKSVRLIVHHMMVLDAPGAIYYSTQRWRKGPSDHNAGITTVRYGNR